MTTVIALCGFAGAGKDTAADRLVTAHGFVKVRFAGPLKRATGLIFNLSDAQLNDNVLKETLVLAGSHITDVDHLLDLLDQATAAVYDFTPNQMGKGPDAYASLKRFPYDAPIIVRLKVRDNFMRHILPLIYRAPLVDKQVSLRTTPRELLQKIGTEVYRYAYADTWVEAWKREAQRHSRVVAPDCRFNNERSAVKDIAGAIWRVDCPWAIPAQIKHVSEKEFQTFFVDAALKNDQKGNPLWLVQQTDDALSALARLQTAA